MAQEEKKRRGYAVGVQTFDWIRERGSVYADKTEYIWKMVSTDVVNFFLGFPNGEVREGFAMSLYKYYMEDYVGSQDTLGNAFQDLRRKIVDIRG